MPSWAELSHFLAQGSPTRRLREDTVLEHLHRASTRTRRWRELVILAFDHRVQLEDLAARHGAGAERIRAFKALVAEGARRGAPRRAGAGIIVDGRFGEDVFPPMTGRGWWVARPVELPGSRPLAFEAGAHLALHLRAWPAEHVAKCLVAYHPHDPAPLREAQLARLAELQAACAATGHEFLVEVIPPRELPGDERTLADALAQIYAAGVQPDWWKLPPPGTDAAWRAITDVVRANDPLCRGVLLLGLEASEEALAQGFRIAAPHAICKGFAVGRSIFGEAAALWFAGALSDEDAIADVAERYARLIAHWDTARAGAAQTAHDAVTPL